MGKSVKKEKTFKPSGVGLHTKESISSKLRTNSLCWEANTIGEPCQMGFGPAVKNQFDVKPKSSLPQLNMQLYQGNILWHTQRKTVFNRLKNKEAQHYLTVKKRCDKICERCDGSFPQSESAPVTAFEHTLHSSDAQLIHKPLPWQQINKKLSNIFKKNKINESAWRHDTSR